LEKIFLIISLYLIFIKIGVVLKKGYFIYAMLLPADGQSKRTKSAVEI
jgi:hypothetical protein